MSSRQQVLFGNDTVGWPNGVTIDYQSEKIYFVDAKLEFVASADFNGKNLRKLVVCNSIFKRNIYITYATSKTHLNNYRWSMGNQTYGRQFSFFNLYEGSSYYHIST